MISCLWDDGPALTRVRVLGERGKTKSSSGERGDPSETMGDGQVTVTVTTGTGDSPGEHLWQIVDEGMKRVVVRLA